MIDWLTNQLYLFLCIFRERVCGATLGKGIPEDMLDPVYPKDGLRHVGVGVEKWYMRLGITN